MSRRKSIGEKRSVDKRRSTSCRPERSPRVVAQAEVQILRLATLAQDDNSLRSLRMTTLGAQDTTQASIPPPLHPYHADPAHQRARPTWRRVSSAQFLARHQAATC